MSQEYNPSDFYYDKDGNWARRPLRDPSVLYFGLPLVDRWFNPKYMVMYENRYKLSGNTNKILTEENAKFDNASFNDLKDDVLKNREEECEVGGEMQIAALASAGSVATVGAVGDDSAKTVCLKALKDAGINPLYKVILNDGTGFRVTYQSSDFAGNPTSCRYTVPRAASAYEVGDLKEDGTEGAIARSSWLYVDGGSFCADRESTYKLAERFNLEGQRIALNVSFTDLIEDGGPLLWRVITLADLIIMNQDTAECFDQHSRGMGNRDWETGARLIAQQPPFGADDSMRSIVSRDEDVINWVVVTRGDKDVAIIEGHPLYNDKTKVSYVKLPPAESLDRMEWSPADRCGVGDIFAGGLVGALAKGQKMEEAVLTGHKLAAYSLTQQGPKLPPKDAA